MQVAKEMKLGTGGDENMAPSGFLYTFRGFKGVHGINTQLDEYKVSVVLSLLVGQ